MMTLSIRNKLFAGFGFVLLLLVVCVIVALSKMGGINEKGVSIGKVDLPSIQYIGDADTAESDFRTAQYRLATATASDIDTAQKLAKDANNAVHKAFKAYEPLISVDQDRGLWTEAQKAWDVYESGNDKIVALARAGKRNEALAAVVDAKKPFDAAAEGLTKWTAFNQKSAAANLDQAASTYSGARTMMIMIAILATLVGVGIAFFLARGISRGVAAVLERLNVLRENDATDLKAALEAMADGDLTVAVAPTAEPIETFSKDEIGEVAQAVNGIRESIDVSIGAYNAMIEKLGGVLGNVSQGASSVSSASQQMASTSEEAGKAVGEIASAVSDVAQGAERQVRGIEIVKTSADGAATAARTSAEQAREATEVAEQARQAAEDGVGSAEEATKAMRAVSESSESVTAAIRDLAGKSEEIGAIVETITGIAGQTNLLALNAAIEAARAGEQGRGFAVVAEEVRKLAEESQKAAEEIAGLIGQIQTDTQNVVGVVENSAQQTEQGADTVQQTREAFVQIGAAVEDVTARIAGIAGAVEQISGEADKMQGEIAEVASVAEQSSASTEQVSASTEQTSASTQEIAASAQELAATAEGLEKLVSQFKVNA
jgi:methyl-accepting chemotaxis protein